MGNREEMARVQYQVRRIREAGRSMAMDTFAARENVERKNATERAIMAARKVAEKSRRAESEG